ncbi:MAG: hypothetical protein MHMPM18_003335 [Marteilia pararefringens]
MTKGRQSGRRILESDSLYGNSKSRGTLVAIPSDCPYPMSEPVDTRSGLIIEDSSDSEGDLSQNEISTYFQHTPTEELDEIDYWALFDSISENIPNDEENSSEI